MQSDAADGKDRWALHDGERHLGQASNRLVDALEITDGTNVEDD